MQLIPIIDTYAQTLNIQLGGQACTINLYQKSTGLFCDLLVNGVVIVAGVICQNVNPIVRGAYLGFIGNLMFNDTQGKQDPSSPGLGSRYVLLYTGA